MEKIVKSIISEVTGAFKNDKNLLSLTPVGSFANINKKLEKFNDIDLVFVFRKIKPEDVIKLNYVGNNIKKEFSDNMTGIVYTLKIGPIKITTKKPKTIMLHFLAYSEKGYKNRHGCKLVRFSYQHYRPILGKAIKEINNVTIGKDDLFNNISGIPITRKRIKTRTIKYEELKSSKNKIISEKLNTNQYLDLITYSILRLASNMLIYLNGKYVDIDEKMCKRFDKTINIRMKTFPQEIISIKKRVRNGEKLSSKEIKELKIKSLEFINQCEAFLKTHKGCL